MTSGNGNRIATKAPTPPPRRILPSGAWQPLTPRGVAAFAGSSLSRLCWYQVVIAALSASILAWFLHATVFPVTREAIQQLPDEGTLRFGDLDMPIPQLTQLAQGSWLALSIDLDKTPLRSKISPREVEVRLTRTGFLFFTDFGYSYLPYYPFWNRPFNRMELIPWWDAWNPMILLVTLFASVAGLLLLWWVLATLYAPMVRLLMFFSDRNLDLAGAWKLSGAALLSGAVIMDFNFIALGMDWITPVHFLGLSMFHLLVPWIFLGVAPLYLPRRPVGALVDGGAKANPFEVEGKAEEGRTTEVPPPTVASPASSAVAKEESPVASAAASRSVTVPKRSSGNPFGAPAAGASEELKEAKKSKSSANPFAGS